MTLIKSFLSDLWNIRWVKGHRTQVAKIGLYLAAAVLGYQTLATSDQLINAGVNLPDLTSTVLGWATAAVTYFSTKIAQFAQEHKANP